MSETARHLRSTEPPSEASYSGTPSGDRFPWWILATVGVLSILFGVAVFVWPDATLYVLAILIGIWLIAAGILRLVAAFANSGASTAQHVISGVIGVLFLVTGVICLRNLVKSLVLLVVIVGLSWLLSGVIELGAAIAIPGPGRGLRIGLGIIDLLVGIALLVWPGLTLSLVVALIGIGAIVVGVAQIAFAFYARRQPAMA